MTITPDTIITAELLAGLDKCPFCGAAVFNKQKREVQLECWTSLLEYQPAETLRSITCAYNEVTTLRARVSELETKVKRLTEAGDRLSNPFSVGENDIKAWTKAKEGA